MRWKFLELTAAHIVECEPQQSGSKNINMKRNNTNEMAQLLCIDTVDENIRKVDVSFSVSVIRSIVDFFSPLRIAAALLNSAYGRLRYAAC